MQQLLREQHKTPHTSSIYSDPQIDSVTVSNTFLISGDLQVLFYLFGVYIGALATLVIYMTSPFHKIPRHKAACSSEMPHLESPGLRLAVFTVEWLLQNIMKHIESRAEGAPSPLVWGLIATPTGNFLVCSSYIHNMS